MLTERGGDLLALAHAGMFDVIAHGVNCCRVMGAGIALQIAKQYPNVYEAVREAKDQTLGDVLLVSTPDCIVANLYTQVYPGGPNLSNDTEQDRLAAIEKSLLSLKKWFPPGTHLGMPLIGSGLARLNWDDVLIRINTVSDYFRITIVHYIPDPRNNQYEFRSNKRYL